MKKRKHQKGLMAEINVVPYIDVMLVLLVIFIITTPLLTEGVKVNMPQATAKALLSQQSLPIIVSVDKDGRYYLNIENHPDNPITAQTLVDRVTAQILYDQTQHIGRPVYIKGDGAAHYGQVVQAMVLLQQAGINNIGLMTQPGQEPQGNARGDT